MQGVVENIFLHFKIDSVVFVMLYSRIKLKSLDCCFLHNRPALIICAFCIVICFA